MATKKRAVQTLSFLPTDQTPAYVNNVRVKATSDNVFIDFGFVDPFAPEGAESSVLQRVVMNRTTFQVFAKHIASVNADVIKPSTQDLPIVIMSRCPPRPEQ